MNDNKFSLTILSKSDTPKYQQLANAINDAIAEQRIFKGELLPSVNSICNENKLSKDTVFKAYSFLNNQGIIVSVPNKGYYVLGETRKILMVLDIFKAYKEVFYHSFINNLPKNCIVDVQFHHYHRGNFKSIINNSSGKYYKYVVMNFNHSESSFLVSAIPNDNLLLLDWNVNSNTNSNYIFQDFGKAFYEVLLGAGESFKKYKEIHLVYSNYTNHPPGTGQFLKKYWKDFNFKYRFFTNPKEFIIKSHEASISLSGRIFGQFLEQCQEKNLEPGKDVGLLFYNGTPMKKFIYKGISVVSTDFKLLGFKAAEFISMNESL